MLYCGLCHPSRSYNENRRKEKESYALRHCQRTKKAVKHKDNSNTNYNWRTWNIPQRLGKGTERVGKLSRNPNHTNYGIPEIGQITEKSP